MTLAISSYEKVQSLADEEGLLNLAWTLDERAYLAVDLAKIISLELAEEMRGDLPFVNSYFVQDPYGEDFLGAAVAYFFTKAGWDCSVTCGAGVNSLLQSLAHLTNERPAYVIGDVYPDFAHWVEQLGGTCLSQYSQRNGPDHINNVRASRASVVLTERPALIGDDLSLLQLRELCDGVAPFKAIVVVDESYANYYPPSFSAVNIASDVQNLVVLRGLSKGYWLGGLRLGYSVASAAVTTLVRAVVPPMLASSLSLRMARAILNLGDITQLLRKRVPAAKEEMTTLLKAAGATHIIPSCEYVPYVFYSGNDLDAQRCLSSLGIVGKLQPFWSDSTNAVTHLYRLSVPLLPERMELLRRKMGAHT